MAQKRGSFSSAIPTNKCMTPIVHYLHFSTVLKVLPSATNASQNPGTPWVGNFRIEIICSQKVRTMVV